MCEFSFSVDMSLDSLRPSHRPTSAKRRGDHATGSGSSWGSSRLGETLRPQDSQRLQGLIGRKTPTNFDEEDDEITQTFSGKKPSSGQSLSQRKTPPTPTGNLLGRKTPNSPQTQELSKEDIIFGRKTPTGT